MRCLALVVSFVVVLVAGCSGEAGVTSIPNSGDLEDGDPRSSSDAGTSEPSDAAAPPTSDSGSPAPRPEAGDPGLGPDEAGEATYYDANGTGACGFKASTDFMVAAMNDEQYQKADCGKCVQVTGPKGTTIVRIVDKCPGCDRGDLDLSMTAFSKIADLSAGRIAIKWRFVACP